ncbi:MAG: hypothetical protein ABIR30_03845 [Chitinophagaceae bacterium]
MKSRFNLAQFIIPGLFLCLLSVACKKETSRSVTDDQEQETASQVSGEADGVAEEIFGGLFDDAMGASNDVGVSGSGVFYGRIDTLTPVPRCFTITILHPNNTPFPVRTVIDFGTTGCPGPDGRVRRGKVITDYTARLTYPGATATTEFEGFYVDSFKVEGRHIITNIGSVVPLVRKFKVEMIDGKLLKTNGNYITWSSTKTINQFEGLGTPDIPIDDIFKIEGSAHGRVLRGNLLVGWESAIIEPLVKRVTCRWLVRGKIRVIRLNSPANSPWVAELDFGNGLCNNQATLTINGRTSQITLP